MDSNRSIGQHNNINALKAIFFYNNRSVANLEALIDTNNNNFCGGSYVYGKMLLYTCTHTHTHTMIPRESEAKLASRQHNAYGITILLDSIKAKRAFWCN